MSTIMAASGESCWGRSCFQARHAHTEALWGPWEHGSQVLTRSSHSWQIAVTREWVRQGAWAKEDFWES